MQTSRFEKPTDYLIQAQDAEQLTNVHRITLLRWANRGIAPNPQKIGGRWFWRHSEIQQLIAGKWEAK
jgi:predicted DNA-binding transcriptional regulator AlpA